MRSITYGGAVVALLALAACDDKKAATTTAEAPAVTTSAAPAVAAPLESQAATVIARALAANGKAEAQVVEATRAGGVLTINLRFQRTQGSSSLVRLFGESQQKDAVYVVAAAKKYFLLTDAEGAPLALPGVLLDLNEATPVAAIWYGKFPAPPPEVKQLSLVVPDVGPLDAVPITDR